MRGRAAAIVLLLAACGAPEYDRALAALDDGDFDAAEGALREGPVDDFLRGNIAFARCLRAERQASTTAAEPFAWDVALLYGRKARDFWQRAAMTRDDWPAARRNVERALLKLEELQKEKEAVQPQRKQKPKPRPIPLPRPGAPEDKPEPVAPRLDKLSPEQVLRLLETLAKKEEEKRALRTKERKERGAGIARDW